MSLDILINPHSQDFFFSGIWEREVLHIARNDSIYFSFLYDELKIEQTIWQTCRKWGDISLARSKTNYDEAPYAVNSPTISTIKKAFNDSYTVVINNLEQKNVRIAQFCRDIEKDCYFNSNINLYFTPANSQGLDYHYDDQDVFIIQLDGRKTWRIYEKKAELPLDDVPYVHLNCDDNTYITYNLNPGDVLYIPRGVIHDAHTLESISVHLTLAISGIRWATLLQNYIHILAQNDLELRRIIPKNILQKGDARAVEALIDKLPNKFNNRSLFEKTINGLQDRLLSTKSRLPTSVDLYRDTAGSIKLESEVHIFPDQVYFLNESEAGVCLKFIGASIEISSELAKAIDFLCRRKRFFVYELPGDLTSNEKIALVKRLVDCEFLTIVDRK